MHDEGIRLVCAGLGGMGKHDWTCAAQVPEFRIVAGVDVVAEKAKAFHDVTGAPVYSDFRVALESVAADAVLISAPDHFHAPYSIAALEMGLDVICEKPMAETLADARAMHAAAERTGRMLIIHHQLRWHPVYAYLRDAVARGDIGVPRRIDFDMSVFSVVCLSGYRSRVKHLMLQDLAIHHFDLMRFISRRDFVSIYARSWPSNEEAHAITANTNVVAIMEMEGPVTVSYRSGMRAIIDQTGYACRIEIHGSRGCLRALDNTVQYSTYAAFGNKEDAMIINHERREANDCWRAFAEAIRTRRPALTDSADNIKSVQALFATVESADTGKVVACVDK